MDVVVTNGMHDIYIYLARAQRSESRCGHRMSQFDGLIGPEKALDSQSQVRTIHRTLCRPWSGTAHEIARRPERFRPGQVGSRPEEYLSPRLNTALHGGYSFSLEVAQLPPASRPIEVPLGRSIVTRPGWSTL